MFKNDPLIALSLEEDIGKLDQSSALVSDTAKGKAQIISREDAILCGVDWFNTIFKRLDASLNIQWHAMDAAKIRANQVICELEGNLKPLLTGERTALNFLQTLSATATQTHRYVQLLKGTSTKLLDTRKTIPGMRKAQKYAVRCGGGHNHRMGLYDAILIKENHILACGSIQAAVTSARQQYPTTFVEVEVENLIQLQEALECRVDRILLDNFTLPLLHEAVAITNKKIPLEASGGISEKNLRSVAETGVDFISLGGLTKNVRAIDFSMRLV